MIATRARGRCSCASTFYLHPAKSKQSSSRQQGAPAAQQTDDIFPSHGSQHSPEHPTLSSRRTAEHNIHSPRLHFRPAPVINLSPFLRYRKLHDHLLSHRSIRNGLRAGDLGHQSPHFRMLKVLLHAPRANFSSENTRGPLNCCGKERWKRFCIACGLKSGIYGPGTQIVNDSDGLRYVKCYSCPRWTASVRCECGRPQPWKGQKEAEDSMTRGVTTTGLLMSVDVFDG